MIYGPGFVEALVVNAFVSQGIFSLEKLDKNAADASKWKEVPRNCILVGSVVCSLCTCVGAYPGGERGYFLRILLLGIVSGGLLAAWVMDVETHLIYDFVWWISGSAALLLWIVSGNFRAVWWDVFCFIMLQQILFGRLYGRADCHAFSVCAPVLGAFGMTMQDYLVHMLISFCILTTIQLVRGNVDSRGRLKEPVPFLPCIVVGFWSVLLTKFFLYIYALHIDFSAVKCYIVRVQT